MAVSALITAAYIAFFPRPPQPGASVIPVPVGAKDADPFPLEDPFAYKPERAEEMADSAATGLAHPLYAYSPGGAIASAERTARWRPQIEDAARQAGVDADRLEGLVFLESAGRPDAMTSYGIKGAVGLSQILAETGTNLLGMRVDTGASAKLTRQIRRSLRGSRHRLARRLQAERRLADERFDPHKSLQATAHYLTLAREHFGREDFAFVSYHMGIGNLEGVLRAYSGRSDGLIADVVAQAQLDWTRVYFDSTPRSHRRAQRLLSSFGDDSSNYFWKVEAAQEVMRLWREDPERLARLARLQTNKASSEEVLHPPETTPRFQTAQELRTAWVREELLPVPNDPAGTGLRPDQQMGELAPRIHQPKALYRGLRPEALALALYLGAQVRAIERGGSLTMTSTVRDQHYQDRLTRSNHEATHGYSLHTTGWAFDVLRAYRSNRQAQAFQWHLDRLSVLGVIAWVREPAAIHVTVAEDARALLPLLERIEDRES